MGATRHGVAYLFKEALPRLRQGELSSSQHGNASNWRWSALKPVTSTVRKKHCRGSVLPLRARKDLEAVWKTPQLTLSER